MEFSISLYGDFENPTVEIPGRIEKASKLYLEAPLYAFLISIPHCIAEAFESIAKKEGIKIKDCKVRAVYEIDEKQFMLGYPVIKKIKVFIYNSGCTSEELEEMIRKVKRECPIYLSFSEKIEILPGN
ncbi:OsmC family protein [Sulfurisphaera ohwakuensis]|uniref:OsmC family protein n=1 Tax=Sulfurisphaera ohwakuensis TaxID=69656 RepID=UPI0036F2FA47